MQPAHGHLEGACIYMSGPMEAVADHGVTWRREFIRQCQAANLKLDFIDPTNKPGGGDMRIGENKEHQSQLKRNGDWRSLKKYVHAYRRYDLRFVDLSDFLVVAVNPSVHMCGTYDELFLAERQHKPTFFICAGGLANLPNWLFDVVEVEPRDKCFGKGRCNVFDSVEAVVDELKLFDTGFLPFTDEWVLVRKHLEHARNQNPY